MKEELKKIEVSLMQREDGSTEDFLSIGKQQLATITMCYYHARNYYHCVITMS